MSLLRSSVTIGSYTLISRVLGFARDTLMATYIGVGIQSDAFVVAFKLPNYFRRLFAEGAFNSAFVPMFTTMLETDGQQRAKQFSEEVGAVLLWILICVTLLAIIFMPSLMLLLSPGFVSNPEKFQLSVTLTRITFPYMLFISLVSLLGGILNSAYKFSAVAATPILMNLCFIGSLMIGPYTSLPAYALAWGVTVAGVVQFLWLVHFCSKLGMMPNLLRIPRMTPLVRTMLRQIGPAALGSGVVQLNLFIDTIIASRVNNGQTYLYYADRISELPLAMIGIAVGTVLLPLLTRQMREGNLAAAHNSQNRAMEFTLLLGLPAALALIVIARPVINVVFQHGHFTELDTAHTYPTLMAFALGLPGFLLVKLLSPGFYANRDTRTPMRIALVCVVLNLILNLALIGYFRQTGMALATTIASYANSAAMGVILYRRGFFKPDTQLLFRLSRIFLASSLMAVGLYIAMELLAPLSTNPSLMIRAAGLIGIIAIGITIYSASILLLKVIDPQELKGYLKRRPKAAVIDANDTE